MISFIFSVRWISIGEGGVGDIRKYFVFGYSSMKTALSCMKCLQMQGPTEGYCSLEVCKDAYPGTTSSFFAAGSCNLVLCGLKRKGSVGSFHVLPSSPVLHYRPHREKEAGPILPAEQVKGDFSVCIAPGPLALLQENSALFQSRLKPCLKRMKEFGRQRKVLNHCLRG